MHIIALDLGTKTGFAEYADREAITERWTLWKKQKDNQDYTLGRRVDSLLRNLERYIVGNYYDPDVVYYEQVRRHLGTDAAHIYGALVGALEYHCCACNVRLVPVGVKVIKKHVTGNGNASKADMLAAARKIWGIDNTSEDEADALGLLKYAIDKEQNID